MRKYIKESLKYLLRTRLFIHKYMDEIDAMYDMTPEELEGGTRGGSWKYSEKCILDLNIIGGYALQKVLSQPTKYNIWKI